MIQIKRAYESASSKDGRRILVDRLWPRGVSKEKLQLYCWEKELAPSTALRKWFNHDPKKWAGFKRKYLAELQKKQSRVKELRAMGARQTVTLIYAAKDEEHNEAVLLAQLLN
ncbi:MAG: hypothetical protein B7X04_00140 [Parcubacteria group bacterium 21-54-25]|nr:MAG: hypothetical protein B7X04_00140 [Parcubacteria group bacterium 21-54-25]HQU07533.1 DUF488 domain-containing protein [Candidatus Paceibacterota bacterium]